MRVKYRWPTAAPPEGGVMAMVMQPYLHDDISQAGVAQQQPAARGDAVCLVLELFWGQFIEIFKPAERKWSEQGPLARK